MLTVDGNLAVSFPDRKRFMPTPEHLHGLYCPAASTSVRKRLDIYPCFYGICLLLLYDEIIGLGSALLQSTRASDRLA